MVDLQRIHPYLHVAFYVVLQTIVVGTETAISTLVQKSVLAISIISMHVLRTILMHCTYWRFLDIFCTCRSNADSMQL